MEKGILVAFEGIDASGKTTQARLIAQEFSKAGRKVVLTREPFLDLPVIAGIISGSGLIRDYKNVDTLTAIQKYPLAPQTDAFLFAADRAEHVHKVIAPALSEGKVVVTDRYYPSSIVYQHTFGGLSKEWLMQVNYFAPKPDVVVLIDLPPEAAAKRVAGETDRRHARFEVLEKQEKIRGAYLQLAREGNWVVVEGTGSKDEVFTKILAELKSRKLL